MTFRGRVAVAVAAAVALSFVVAMTAVYVSTQRTLLVEVDSRLLDVRDVALGVAEPPRGGPRPPARGPGGGPGGGPVGGGPEGFGDLLRAAGITQLVDADGEILGTFPSTAPALPVDGAVVAVAAAGAGVQELSPATVVVDGGTYRTVVFSPVDGTAVQLARPIDEIEAALGALRWQLALASVVAVGLAALAGRFVASRVLRPVERLTGLAEEVARTQDLAHRIGLEGSDELARLGAAIDGMLEALAASRTAQTQLVADASHELRTPLTSLRTNVELLTDVDRLDATDRAALRRDVLGQVTELTTLVGNLVELARDGRPATSELVEVHLDELVSEVVERQRRLTPGVEIVLDAEPARMAGEPERLRRAVANLLDNAVKYGDGGAVEVTVGAHGVRVRDHGAGVADNDAPHVFDRFWRSAKDRGTAGSGLGLAIVAQVASSHGGEVGVRNAPDGGAVFELRLPTH